VEEIYRKVREQYLFAGIYFVSILGVFFKIIMKPQLQSFCGKQRDKKVAQVKLSFKNKKEPELSFPKLLEL